MIITLNLFHSCIEIDDRTIVCALRTPKGWRWFSNVGRVGNRMDFKTSEEALRAAAKTMGLKIGEVVA